MKSVPTWSFAFLLLYAAAGHAQGPPDPPLTGFVYVITYQNSGNCQQCQSYGTGVCTAGSPSCSGTSFPFAACQSPSTMRLLSSHYCDVWLGDQIGGFSGYCYTYLCFGSSTNENVGLGAFAGQNLNLGFDNTVLGWGALRDSITGSGDVAVGAEALSNVNVPNQGGFRTGNTALGAYALTWLEQGRYNVAVGGAAGFGLRNGSNNIYLGDVAQTDDFAFESDTIRIGVSQTRTFIGGIRNAALGNDPLPVYIDSSGQMGLYAPSAAVKRSVAEGDRATDDTVVRLQRRIEVQEERIATLTRALQEQAVQLGVISLRLTAQSQRSAGQSTSPAPLLGPSISPPPQRRRRFRFWRSRD